MPITSSASWVLSCMQTRVLHFHRHCADLRKAHKACLDKRGLYSGQLRVRSAFEKQSWQLLLLLSSFWIIKFKAKRGPRPASVIAVHLLVYCVPAKISCVLCISLVPILFLQGETENGKGRGRGKKRKCIFSISLMGTWQTLITV